MLSALFFARGDFYDTEALPRRRTLQSILQLAGLLGDQGAELNESIFRSCSYSGTLPNGKLWKVPASLGANRTKWAIYARNELLSVAVQGLFYVLLDAYEESGFRFGSSKLLVDWYMKEPETRSALRILGSKKPFSRLVSASGEWLAPMKQWKVRKQHEIQCAEEIVQLCRSPKGADTRRRVLIDSLRIIIALAARRGDSASGYGDLVFDEEYFRYYTINLRAFQYHSSRTWTSLTAHEVLRWLLIDWGVEVHLRVALRKLRGQSQSTFRIRPSDRGMEVTEVPAAVHTRPRFNQALRILKDIGALEKSASDRWVPSATGASMLELGDAP